MVEPAACCGAATIPRYYHSVIRIPPEVLPYLPYLAAFAFLVILWCLLSILYAAALREQGPWKTWGQGMVLLAVVAALVTAAVIVGRR